jgi:hypothetical protein
MLLRLPSPSSDAGRDVGKRRPAAFRLRRPDVARAACANGDSVALAPRAPGG